MKPSLDRPPPDRLPRFTIARDAIEANVAHLRGPELHHMRAVMRLRPDDPVILIDDGGVEYRGTIVRYNRGHAVIEIFRRDRAGETCGAIILAQAIIKGPRMDFIVEKAAELGAAEFWPVMCARGVVRHPGAERIRRWERIAAAAAKQSLAARAMAIRDPIAFGEMVANVVTKAGSATFAIMLTIGAQSLAAVLRKRKPGAVTLIACGPEGDFDGDETACGIKAGFVAAGLGRHRLRSETAAIAALSIASVSVESALEE